MNESKSNESIYNVSNFAEHIGNDEDKMQSKMQWIRIISDRKKHDALEPRPSIHARRPVHPIWTSIRPVPTMMNSNSMMPS